MEGQGHGSAPTRAHGRLLVPELRAPGPGRHQAGNAMKLDTNPYRPLRGAGEAGPDRLPMGTTSVSDSYNEIAETTAAPVNKPAMPLIVV